MLEKESLLAEKRERISLTRERRDRKTEANWVVVEGRV